MWEWRYSDNSGLCEFWITLYLICKCFINFICYTASDGRMIVSYDGTEKIWKETVMVCIKMYPTICLERLRLWKICQDSEPLDQGSNLGPLEYEAGVLTLSVGFTLVACLVLASKHPIYAKIDIHFLLNFNYSGMKYLYFPPLLA
jgi:hypothetical protein